MMNDVLKLPEPPKLLWPTLEDKRKYVWEICDELLAVCGLENWQFLSRLGGIILSCVNTLVFPFLSAAIAIGSLPPIWVSSDVWKIMKPKLLSCFRKIPTLTLAPCKAKIPACRSLIYSRKAEISAWKFRKKLLQIMLCLGAPGVRTPCCGR